MAETPDPENTILIELKDGTVTIELLPDVAPKHAERMKELARAGAYDGVVFHRVIDGFMAQTGDVEHGKEGGDTYRAGTGARICPICRPSSPSCRMTGGRWGQRAHRTRTRRIRSSSSTSPTTIS